MLEIKNRIGIPESKTSGLDSLSQCKSKKHYLSYKKDISYKYNSKGFRDHEWPEDLSNVIWCVGDSFTVGIGQPFEETWSQILQKKTKKRCINLGEDGCSNDTMTLRIKEVFKLHNPKLIVVMWSYLARRRTNGENVHHDKNDFGNKEDMENFIKNFKIVNELPITVINTIIPKAYARTDSLNWFIKKITGNISWELTPVQQLDWARDYHHFDIKTSNNIVDHICDQIYKLQGYHTVDN